MFDLSTVFHHKNNFLATWLEKNVFTVLDFVINYAKCCSFVLEQRITVLF